MVGISFYCKLHFTGYQLLITNYQLLITDVLPGGVIGNTPAFGAEVPGSNPGWAVLLRPADGGTTQQLKSCEARTSAYNV